MKVLEEIQKFEKDFIAAGKLASKMCHRAQASFKSNTGLYELDVVTTADIAVQKFILERLSKSEELRKCQLLAEENTEFTDKFAKKSDLVLTLDPIDGTYLFANGKKMWKVIIGIHDKKRPLYTFCYFPEYDWAVKMVGDKCTYIGQRPDLKLKNPIPTKAITYGVYGKTVDNPDKLFPTQCKKLKEHGYTFMERKEISDEPSTTGQFLVLADKLEGLIMNEAMGSAVDILVGLHFGLSNDYEVVNEMDLSKPINASNGVGNYKGYYLVLKK